MSKDTINMKHNVKVLVMEILQEALFAKIKTVEKITS